MSAFITQVTAADRRLLWLDDTDYSAHLLAGGRAPWLDSTAYVAWRRKAHSLLRPDVVALPVARVSAALIGSNPDLRPALAAKSRTNFPLKTLLAFGDLRRQIGEMLVGLRSSFPALPLALVCPSPRAWVTDVYRAAFGSAGDLEVGEDEIDAATLHCADFLREFAACGIDTVLLEENADSELEDATQLDWYRSVLNVGAHYRWDMGLRIPGVRFQGEAAGFSYVISPHPVSTSCFGQLLPQEFWSQGQAAQPSMPDFRFSEVPVGMQPELVLDRLATVRSP